MLQYNKFSTAVYTRVRTLLLHYLGKAGGEGFNLLVVVQL
jgi:hypothetical protein